MKIPKSSWLEVFMIFLIGIVFIVDIGDAQVCVTISLPTVMFYGQTAIFSATINNGTYIAFTVDFGDNTMATYPIYNVTTLPATVNLYHNYTMLVNNTFTSTYQIAAMAWSDGPLCNATVHQSMSVLNKILNASTLYPSIAANYMQTNISVQMFEGNAVEFLMVYGDQTNATQPTTELFAINSNTGLPPSSAQFLFSHMYTYITGNTSNMIESFVSNLVSGSMITNCSIGVEEQLQNFSVSGNSSVTWPFSTTGQWTVALGLNPRNLVSQLCIWKVGIGTMPYYKNFTTITLLLTASQPSTLSYTFAEADAGQQYVAVNCSNDISYQAYNMTVSVILDQILFGAPSLVYNSPLFWNNTAQFALNITRFGTGACIEFNPGDGINRYLINGSATACNGVSLMTNPTIFLTISPIAQVLFLNYSYTLWGNYTVIVRGYNIVNNISASLNASILPWICSPPNVTSSLLSNNPSSPTTVQWSQASTLSSIVQINCMKNEGQTETWDVFYSSQLSANPNAAPVYSVSNAVNVLYEPNPKASYVYTTAANFSYTPRMFLCSFYTFRITTSMYNWYFNMSAYTTIVYFYVQVQEPIISLVLNGTTSLVWSPGNANWSVSLGSTQPWLMNITCIWHIGNLATYNHFLPTLNASKPDTLSYTFARANCGMQLITVNCSNSISSQINQLNVNLILDTVNVSSLTYNGPFYWNVTMSALLSITRFGTGACFEWDMGDGSPHIIYQGPDGCTGVMTAVNPTFVMISNIAQVINQTYWYSTFGAYTVTVRYFNHINDNNITLMANVWQWVCFPPLVTISSSYLNPSSPFVTTVLKGFTINATINITCMKNEALNIRWSVFNNAQFTANPSTATALLTATSILPNTQFMANPSTAAGLFTTITSNQYTCASYLLLPNVYVVQMAMSVYSHYFNMTGYNLVNYAYISVTHSALAIGIQGAPYTSVFFNSTSTLLASSLTYDPDIPDITNKTGIIFRWLCKLANESWPSSGTANLSVLNAHLASGNNGGCFGDGPGVIANYTTLDLNYDTSLFAPLKNYTFRLEIQKDIRSAASEITIYISFPPTPVLSVGCIGGNCLARVSCSQSLVIQATCNAACWSVLGSLSVVWSLYVGGQQESGAYTLYANLSSIAQTGINQMAINIAPYSLQTGIWYYLVVSGTTPVSLVGNATYYFFTNVPPSAGSCTVSPKTGQATVTEFTVSCGGWVAFMGSASQLVYQFRIGYRNVNNTQWFYSGFPPSTPVTFPLGNPADDNYMSSVYVLITDAISDLTTYTVDVQVLPPQVSTTDLLNSGSTAVANLLSAPTSGPAAAAACNALLSIMSAMNSQTYTLPGVTTGGSSSDGSSSGGSSSGGSSSGGSSSGGSSSGGSSSGGSSSGGSGSSSSGQTAAQAAAQAAALQKDTEMRTTLLTGLTAVPVASSTAMDQRNSIYQAVLAKPSAISTASLGLVANSLSDMANTFTTLAANMSTHEIVNSASNVLGSVSAVFGVTNTIAAHPSSSPAQLKAMSQTTLNAVAGVSNLVMSRKQIGDKPSVITLAGTMTVVLVMNPAAAVGNSMTSTPFGSLSFAGISCNASCTTQSVVSTNANPYIWDPSARNITSPVVTVTINQCAPVASSNSTSTNATVAAGRKKRSADPGAIPVTSGNLQVGITTQIDLGQSICYNTSDQYGMLTHVYNLTDPGVVPIILRVTSNMPSNDTNATLIVYIRRNLRPTPVDYDYVITSPNVTSGSQPVLMMYLEPNMTFNATSLNVGVQSVAYGCMNSSIECTKRIVVQLQYYIYFQQITCHYWDDTNNVWKNSPCSKPTDLSQPATFHSNLLGGFGAGFVTPINTIDFGSLLDNLGQKLLDAAIVWGTLIGIIILYIPFAVISRRMDKRDTLRWMTLPLMDNFSEDEFVYEIHVHTGFKTNASTKSKVFFRLYGTEGETGVRKMDDGIKTTHFERGRVDSFIMRTPDYLGTPINMQIWHDNSGGKQHSWYLNKVVLIDIKEQNWFMFLCDKWLAVDKDDQQTRRSLRASQAFVQPDSTNLMRKHLTHKIFDDHMWLSVGYRAKKSLFTRAQRLGACMATLFLAMIANCMLFKDAAEGGTPTPALFNIGPIAITATQIFNSIFATLIVLPPMIIITTLFSKSGAKPVADDINYSNFNNNNNNQSAPVRKNKGFPYWCNYIAWTLVFLTIFVSGIFTVMYSMTWGKQKSTDWLTAFLLSFVQSAVVVQPVKVIIIAILMSFIIKKDPDLTEYEADFGEMKAVDHSQGNSLFACTDTTEEDILMDEIAKSEHKAKVDGKMKDMIREILFYLGFLVLLLVVVNGQQNSNSFNQNNNLIITLTTPGLNNETFIQAGFYTWANKVLLPALYLTAFYNGKRSTAYDQNYMNDMNSWRIGPPRLRQLRVKPEPCPQVPSKVRNIRCTNSYDFFTEDKAAYETTWIPAINASSLLSDVKDLSDLQQAFIHTSNFFQDDDPYIGTYATYAGSGYTANLGTTFAQAQAMMQGLEENRWIDAYTRAIFAEFNLLNPGSGLANYALILVEFPTNGDISWSWRMEVIQLYRYTGANGVVNIFTEGLCALFVVVVTILEVNLIWKQRQEYFKSVWNCIQIISLMLFYIAVALYAMRCMWTVWIIDDMMNNPGQLVSFSPIVRYNTDYLILLGLVTFLTQCQLLHLLRYNKTIAILGNTLRESSSTMLGFGVIFSIIFYAYCITCNQLFYQLQPYSSMTSTMSSLIVAFLGKFNFYQILDYYGSGAGFFIMSYLLLMMIFVTNIFIAILVEFLEQVGNERALSKKDHEIVDHFIDTVKSFVIGKKEEQKPDTAVDNVANLKYIQDLVDSVNGLEHMADTMMKASNKLEKTDMTLMCNMFLRKSVK